VPGSSLEALSAFAEELVRLREACGAPSLNELVARSAGWQYPLARSTISDKLNAKSIPDWDFVASFVTACRSYAESAAIPIASEVADLEVWDNRHLRLLRDMDSAREAERLTKAAASALRARESARLVPRQLPAAVRGFAGRSEHVRMLNDLAGEAALAGSAVIVAAIHGTAGVGKTTLAVHAAHVMADRYPDGQLFVNLRGFDPSGQVVSADEAVRRFLVALSVPPERIPASLDAQASLYRTILAGRRVLVLLDNARDAEHVRPLIPGTSGSLVLVTSRDRLTSLVARDAAASIELDLFTDDEAWQLLAGRIGRERVSHEAEAAREIIARCARLPLALSVVAARASAQPTHPLTALAHALRTVHSALQLLDTDDRSTGVGRMLSWSYRQLTEDAASMLRAMALHPGPDITVPAAASLVGIPLPESRHALEELAAAHLVEEQRPGRFGFHDLLRAYAGELSDEVDPVHQRRTALQRLLDHYLHTAFGAALRLNSQRPPVPSRPAGPGVAIDDFADQAEAMAWFTAERPALLGLIDRAAGEGFDEHAWQLAWAMADFLNRQGHWHDWARSHETALAAAGRLDDRPALARMHRNLGLAYGRMDQPEQAARHCRRALALHRALGDRVAQAQAHLNLGGIAANLADAAADERVRRSRSRLAMRHGRRAADLLEAAGEHVMLAHALNSMGWAHTLLGEYGGAIAVCQRALGVFEAAGERRGQALTWDSLGYARHHLKDHAEAVVCYRRAIELYAEVDDRFGESQTWINLGDTHRAAGDPEAARSDWGRALAILTAIDHPSADSLRERLATLD
jgi:tetratricopeptide (TPR) repeat protein